MKYLLISPILFDYYKDMISFLEKKGNNVIWYYDSIKPSIVEKIINKFKSDYLLKKFDKYWNKIVSDNVHEKFDRIVLIYGDRYIKKNHIIRLLNSHKEAKSIYYGWDSIINCPNVLEYYNLFDKYMSFDKRDCKKYGFIFRPLFYLKNDSSDIPQYDYCSLMSYGYKKADNYFKIKQSLPSNVIGREYLYVNSRISLLFNKLLYRKAYKGISNKCFKFKALNRQESYEFMSKSKAVIDAPLVNQTGLTIRTFEALYMKKKIITTNIEIKNYDFYTSDNIFVVDDGAIIEQSFFENEFDSNYSISSFYSFEVFMKEVFETEND